MIDHYNAFISYKHSPLDNKVAETVQKELEHFHIPDKIKKTSGMKRIQRVFRDKDELPITSDLSDTISNALEHSDYLIVICSTRTKESIWVSREIEYFLRNHTKRQILTVLVDGEPQDVIPEVLQYEDRIITDEYGRTQTIRTPLEPLSCDFRTSFSKAKKVEIPRLASALIGCSYDELMNRRRQYVMRQMIMAFSGIFILMSAFIGYMFFTRQQIKKNYMTSLENQSKYLANESEYLMENEQRITAIQLALEALPKDENDDRPVVPEALRALTKSTLAYSSSEANSVHAVWNYQMTNVVSDFVLSPDSSTMAAYDFSDYVFVWNTSSHETIFSKHYSKEHICGVKYITNDKLLVWSEYKMRYFNISNGELIWELETEEFCFESDEPALIKDDLLLANSGTTSFITIDLKNGAIKDTYSVGANATEVSNPELLATSTDAVSLDVDIPQVDIPDVDIPNVDIPTIDLDDATGTDAVSEDADEAGTDKDVLIDILINNYAVSEDKNLVAFTTYMNWSYYMVGIFNIQTGKTIYIKTDEWVKNIDWLDKDHILIAQTSDTMNSNMSVGNQSIVTDNTNYIFCLNVNDLSTAWKHEFISNDVSLNSEFLDLGEDSIAYYTGNVCEILDKKTGKLLNHYNVNSSIINISDTNGDGIPVFITTDGGVAIPTDSPNTVSIINYLTQKLEHAIPDRGFYVQQEYSTEIIYYGINVYDNDWKELSDDTISTNAYNDVIMNDQLVAILSSDDSARLLIYRMGDKSHCKNVELNDQSAFGYDLLGIYKEKLYLATKKDETISLLDVDVDSGKVNTRELFKSHDLPSESIAMKDDTLVYLKTDEEYNTTFNIMSISSGKTKTIDFPEKTTSDMSITGGYLDGNYVYLADDVDSVDYLVDLNEEKMIEINKPEKWDRTFKVAISSGKEKYVAINDSTNIAIYDTKGNQVQYIDSHGTQTYGINFYMPKGKKAEEQLLVTYSDQTLKKIDLKTGEPVDETDITISALSTVGMTYTESEDKSLLFFQADNVLNIIDTKDWITLCSIQNSIGYYKPKDIILTYGYDQNGLNKVGYFKHYTTEELIEKAHSILQGATLSEELKDKYGLKDD